MAMFSTSDVPLSASLLVLRDLMTPNSAAAFSPWSFDREDDDVYLAGTMYITGATNISMHGVIKVDISTFPWWICRAQTQASAYSTVNYYNYYSVKLDPDDENFIYVSGWTPRSGGYYDAVYRKLDKNTLSSDVAGSWSWGLTSTSTLSYYGYTVIPSAGAGKVWCGIGGTQRLCLAVLNATTGLTSDYVCGGIYNGVDDHLSYSTASINIIDGLWYIFTSNGGNKTIDIHYVSDGQSAIDYFAYSPVTHYYYNQDLIDFDDTYIITNQNQGSNGTPIWAGGPVKVQKSNPYTEAWCANFKFGSSTSSLVLPHATLTSAGDYVISSGYSSGTPACGVIVKVATSDGATGFSRIITPKSNTSDIMYGSHAEAIAVCGEEYLLIGIQHLVDKNSHLELLDLSAASSVSATRYNSIDSGIYGSGGWFVNGALTIDTTNYVFGSMSIKASSSSDRNGALSTYWNKNYGVSGTSFSIDFWINFPSGEDGYACIASWVDDDLKGYEIYYDRLATGALTFLYYNAGLGDWVEVESNDVGLGDGQWHHVAITRSAEVSAMYFFVDGSSVGVNTTTTSHPTTYANYSITDPQVGCPMKVAVCMNALGEPDYYFLNAYRLRLGTCAWSADFVRPSNVDDYDPDTSHILLMGDLANLSMLYSTDQVTWKQLSPNALWDYADGLATEGDRIASLKLTDTTDYGKYHESPLELDGLSGENNEVDFCIVPTTAATAGHYWFRFCERYVPIDYAAFFTYPSLYYTPPGGTEEPTGAYVIKVMRHMKWFSNDEQYQGFWLGGR